MSRQTSSSEEEDEDDYASSNDVSQHITRVHPMDAPHSLVDREKTKLGDLQRVNALLVKNAMFMRFHHATLHDLTAKMNALTQYRSEIKQSLRLESRWVTKSRDSFSKGLCGDCGRVSQWCSVPDDETDIVCRMCHGTCGMCGDVGCLDLKLNCDIRMCAACKHKKRYVKK